MAASTARIEHFLNQAGRKYRELNEDHLLILFRGENVETIPIYISCSDTFVTLYTPLMAPPKTNLILLYERLLDLSFRVYLAKFSLDSMGTPLLQTQWPVENIAPEEFSIALEGLVAYADRYYRELHETVKVTS